jgi:hypothetical protein
MRLWLMPLVISDLRAAFTKAFAKLRSRSLLDISWAEESFALSPYRGPDPADQTLKYIFGDAPIENRSPWFPRKKITCWITWEILGPDGRLVQIEIKPPLWYCSEN